MPTNLAGFTSLLDELCKRALRIIGKADDITPEMLNQARDALNGFVKSLSTRKIFLWETEKTITPIDVSGIVLHNNVSYVCLEPHYSSPQMEPGISPNWKIYWAIGGTSTTPWVSGNEYSSPNTIFTGIDCNSIQSPYLLKDGARTPLILQDKFIFLIQNREQIGDPQLIWLEKGKQFKFIHIWPTPYELNLNLEYYKVKVLSHLTLIDEEPDLPIEWHNALVFGLAADLAYEYGKPVVDLQNLERKADIELRKAFHSNFEITEDNFIQPLY